MFTDHDEPVWIELLSNSTEIIGFCKEIFYEETTPIFSEDIEIDLTCLLSLVSTIIFCNNKYCTAHTKTSVTHTFYCGLPATLLATQLFVSTALAQVDTIAIV